MNTIITDAAKVTDSCVQGTKKLSPHPPNQILVSRSQPLTTRGRMATRDYPNTYTAQALP